ncbi:hypothetical protein PCCS19_04240 [Paenibacillus sp. CCS19]|nr:hypothetical protein PCCS19_04240 [Paenibacillus cellulosilyticus]
MFASAEWIAILMLLFLLYRENVFMTGAYSSEQAHQQSESSYHYGPSTIARKVTVPFDKDQVIFLGIYKEWFSADSVKKQRGGWFAGGGVAGVPIERDKGLTFSWEGTSTGKRSEGLMMYKFYGYVSDETITAVELLMKDAETGNPETMRETITDDRMFLFLWQTKNARNDWQTLRGYDKEGNVVYEHSFLS